ncbi:MAG: pH regulation protein F [Deltaproteobacteria bacterium]|nr:MAG: pH regulation protein F [Deltaproteobacteria bacterium]
MDLFFDAAAVFLVLLMIPTLYRIIKGPVILDRIMGGNMIGTKTTVLILFIGQLYGSLDMFIDIALAYALLNFIATLGATKYFLRRQRVFFKDELADVEEAGS